MNCTAWQNDRDRVTSHLCRFVFLIVFLVFVPGTLAGANSPEPPNISMEFHGQDGIQINDPDGLYRLTRYTYSFWIKVFSEPESGADQVLSKGLSRQIRGPAIKIWDNKKIIFKHDPGRQGMGSVKLPIGEWTHLAAVSTGSDGKMTLFLNGNEMASTSVSGIKKERQKPFLTIGNGYGHHGLDARMGDVRVYDRALSRSEIRNVYRRNILKKGLVGWWPLDQGHGKTVYDVSANVNHGTFRGSPQWVVPDVFDQSLPEEIECEPDETVTLGPVKLKDSKGEVTYQWYHNRKPIKGATDNQLTIRDANADDLGAYYVTVNDQRDRTPVKSHTLQLHGWSMWRTDLPVKKSFSGTDNVTLGPVQLRDPHGDVTFQWFYNGEPIDGATENTLTIRNPNQKLGTYYVTANDDLDATPVTSTRLRLFRSMTLGSAELTFAENVEQSGTETNATTRNPSVRFNGKNSFVDVRIDTRPEDQNYVRVTLRGCKDADCENLVVTSTETPEEGPRNWRNLKLVGRETGRSDGDGFHVASCLIPRELTKGNATTEIRLKYRGSGTGPAVYSIHTRPEARFSYGQTEVTVRARRLNNGESVLGREQFLEVGVSGHASGNINGPSVVKVPDWVPEHERPAKEAKYYMYFANHRGRYIRMAYAEHPEGPWKLYNIGNSRNSSLGSEENGIPPRKTPGRGVVDLDAGPNDHIETGSFRAKGEIASPDVRLDHENERFVMYLHAPANTGVQETFVTTSPFGLNFNNPEAGGVQVEDETHGFRDVIPGIFYFRTFEVAGRTFAFANNGNLYRAPARTAAGHLATLANADEPGGLFHPQSEEKPGRGYWEYIDSQNNPIHKIYKKQNRPPRTNRKGTPTKTWDPRHFAVLHEKVVDPDLMFVAYSTTYDTPERIWLTVLDLSGLSDRERWKPDNWQIMDPHQLTLLEPARAWEGVNKVLEKSHKGGATGVRELRDPVFLLDDGRIYMYYTGKGESAIGLAELEIRINEDATSRDGN